MKKSKPATKPLLLTTQTVRVLSTSELPQVAGAGRASGAITQVCPGATQYCTQQ